MGSCRSAVFTAKLDIESSQMSKSTAPEGAKEDLLGRQIHEYGIDAVDRHLAVDQRTHAVIIADCHR